MKIIKKKAKRDIEKNYPTHIVAVKLRRLADALDTGKRITFQVAGERISVPKNAIFTVEHERGSSEEELEFQLKWKLKKGKK